MSIPVFAPKRDADLLAWSNNFEARVSASPAMYGLSVAQAGVYSGLHAAFAAAYATARSPNTNSKANVNAKNVAREQLLNGSGGARALVNIVQAFPGTTDDMRAQLGLRIRDRDLSPIAAPSAAPSLTVLYAIGRLVKVRLRDRQSADRRGKPEGALGATVLYCVGEGPSEHLSNWSFAMNTSRPVFDVEIPGQVPAGSQVWLTAFWFNARMEVSPSATPASVHISQGLAAAA